MYEEVIKQTLDGNINKFEVTAEKLTIEFNEYVTIIAEQTDKRGIYRALVQIDVDGLRDEEDSSSFDEDFDYYLMDQLRNTSFASKLNLDTFVDFIDVILSEEELGTLIDILVAFVTEEGQA